MPTVVLSIASATNIATAEGQDAYFQQVDIIERLPPVYVFDNYSIDVTASLELNEEDNSHTISSIAISSIESNLFQYTETVNSVTIETGSNTPFDDYWEFLMPDETYVEVNSPDDLVVNGTKTFSDLIQWSPPAESSVDVTHNITVIYYDDTSPGTLLETTIPVTQGMYFKYEPYTNTVKQIASNTYVT